MANNNSNTGSGNSGNNTNNRPAANGNKNVPANIGNNSGNNRPTGNSGNTNRVNNVNKGNNNNNASNSGNAGNASKVNNGNNNSGNVNRGNNGNNGNNKNNLNANLGNNNTKNGSSNNTSNNTSNSTSNSTSSTVESAKGKLAELGKNKTLMQVLKLLGIAIVTFLIMYGIRRFLRSQIQSRIEAPFIIKGSNSGKNSIVVSQNPAEDNSITLYRSDGEEGAEFTYTTWLLIQSMEYKVGEWKHVFHKGNKTSFPNRAPGIWIHPNNNALRIYMNTYNNPLEYVDVENIPVKKWFHIGISLNHKYLDIYFNGQLRKRKELDSLPRQNYGDLWCCLYGGFEGYISKLQYHRKALDYDEIEAIVRAGPSKDACGNTGEYPPYLDDSWWYDI